MCQVKDIPSNQCQQLLLLKHRLCVHDAIGLVWAATATAAAAAAGRVVGLLRMRVGGWDGGALLSSLEQLVSLTGS